MNSTTIQPGDTVEWAVRPPPNPTYLPALHRSKVLSTKVRKYRLRDKSVKEIDFLRIECEGMTFELAAANFRKVSE